MEKKNEKLVSIIVPVYNVEKYIKETIDSLLKQTYTNIEIILIDDGSTDSSGKICDIYKNSKTKVIHQNNKGVSFSRNKGIELAKGEYIVFVDSDDIVSNLYIERLVNTIEDNNVDLVITGYTNQKENLIESYKEFNNEIESISSSYIYNRILAKDRFEGYLWNKIFKKEIIDKNSLTFPINVKVWEDMYFYIRYLKCIEKVIIISDKLYYYRIRKESATNKLSMEKINSKSYICKEFMKLEENKQSLFYKNALELYTKNYIEYLFYGVRDKRVTKDILKKEVKEIKTLLKKVKIERKYFIRYIFLKFKSI